MVNNVNLKLRALSEAERERAFARTSSALDLRQYEAAVRGMEGGVGYAFEVNGASRRSLTVRFNRAAKSVGLRLRWAKQPKDARELVVELAA